MTRYLAMTRKNKLQNGSSLIEILVATGVVALVLTAITASMAYSIMAGAEARYRDLATQVGNQAMEIIKRERVLRGWQNFYVALSGDNYCLNQLPAPLANFTAGNCGSGASSYGLDLQVGRNFKRLVTISRDPSGEWLETTVKVYWNELTEDVSCNKNCVSLKKRFSRFE